MTLNRNVRRTRAGGVALAAALGALAAGAAWAADGTLKVGDAFPDLARVDLEGDLPPSLTARVVIVDFWASWCAPCKDTFPLLEELHHRFGKQGLVILGVNEDKNRTAMKEFLKDYPVTFSVVRDAKKKLAAQVNVPALPTSYVLDGKGRVLWIESGHGIAENRKAFTRRVERLLHNEDEGKP